MTSSFSLFTQTLTEISSEVLASPEILLALSKEGVRREDLHELEAEGKKAAEGDVAQRAALQKLAPLQTAVAVSFARINAGVDDIKRRRKGVLEDLAKDPEAVAEDAIFVRELSFTAFTTPSKENSARSKAESRAQDVRRYELSRVLSEIEKRPRVAAAFIGRELNIAALRESAAPFLVIRKARDDTYQAWQEAGEAERRAVRAQRRAWDRIRRGVARAAKTLPAVRDMLDRLATARERCQPKKKRPKKAA
jgi:hypothetical protein